MNRIKILNKVVAGRIAAGEVVTGPAAVVKELVENSIDAGSGAVTVEIRDGGKTYIRVTDNGSGIYPDDVLLSVQKHATSKIFDIEDMNNIASLGFRGEALSSIAAVSRLAIRTRAAGESEGCVMEEGAAGFFVKPAGLPDGTTVTVENLFYNVPARYKFLKSAQAETAAITDLITRLILCRPDISFKYITNGSLQLMSPGTGDQMDAIVSIYGRDVKQRILKISAISGEISLAGYVSNPNFLFKSAKNQTILINKRYIRSKSISDALARAYGERLLKAHFPFAVLDIRLPFSKVDVNVHPSKTTVMIQEEETLLSLLDHAVKDALLGASLPRFEVGEQPDTDTNPPDPLNEEYTDDNLYIEETPSNTKVSFRDPSAPVSYEMPGSGMDQIWPEEDVKEAEELEEQQAFGGVNDLLDYMVMGQLFDTYILVQSGEAVYIIDQHAAHERINYERLRARETLLPQKLLFPHALRLSAADHDVLLKNTDFLRTLGFDLEDFGGTTIKITALPLKAEPSNAGELIEDVLTILKDTRTGKENVLKDRIIRRACRTSVKAGDPLSSEEMRELVLELTQSDTPPTCPHGRPVAIVLTRKELEKGFKRRV
jgi:DNA mismatch repair protein MutL